MTDALASIRCPACGSIWTYPGGVNRIWKCRYCHATFPAAGSGRTTRSMF